MSWNVRQYSNIYPVYGLLTPEYASIPSNDITVAQQLRASLRQQYEHTINAPDTLAPRSTMKGLLTWLGVLRVSLLRLHVGRLVQLLDLFSNAESTWLDNVDCLCVDFFGVQGVLEVGQLTQYKDLLHAYLL